MRKRAGIYAFINKLNGKVYVGQSVNLLNRINDYSQPAYFKTKGHLPILRALKKYTMKNFCIIILEYVEIVKNPKSLWLALDESENRWLALLKPEYNILELAKSSRGYKHSLESKDKIRTAKLGKLHSAETKQKMSESSKGINSTWFGKNLSAETKAKLSAIALRRTYSHKPGIVVKVVDIKTNITTLYSSIRSVALALNSNHSTLLRRDALQIQQGIHTPYRKRYLITIQRS